MLRKFLSNCKKPQGKFGKMVVNAMNKGHAPLCNWAFDLVSFDNEEKVLDVGCGGGGNIIRLLKKYPSIKVDGVDYSATSVESSIQNTQKFKSRTNIVCGDVMNLPFEDNSYDKVISFESIYFWPDPVEGLKEIAMVLKDKGRIILALEMTNPQKAQFWTKRCEGMNIYTPEELKEFLLKAGFEDIQLHTAKKVWCLAEGVIYKA